MGPERGRSTIDRGCELEAGSSCTVWNERHRTRLACRRPGAGAHRDIERGKVPRAARVACIARAACTSLDQNSNKSNFSEQSGTMGRTLGYIYTHLSTTAVSPILYCFTMSWWVGGSLRGFQCCTTYCCTAVVLLYCCCTGLWVGRSVLSCGVLLSCVHTGSWVCLFLLPLYRPRAGIVGRAASDYDYYSGVLILGFTKKKIVRACSMFCPKALRRR